MVDLHWLGTDREPSAVFDSVMSSTCGYTCGSREGDDVSRIFITSSTRARYATGWLISAGWNRGDIMSCLHSLDFSCLVLLYVLPRLAPSQISSSTCAQATPSSIQLSTGASGNKSRLVSCSLLLHKQSPRMPQLLIGYQGGMAWRLTASATFTASVAWGTLCMRTI